MDSLAHTDETRREALEDAFTDWLASNSRLLEVGLPGDVQALADKFMAVSEEFTCPAQKLHLMPNLSVRIVL